MYVLSTLTRFHAPQVATALASRGVEVDLHVRDLKASSPSARVHLHRGGPSGLVEAILARVARDPSLVSRLIQRLDDTVARFLEAKAWRPSRFHGFSFYSLASLGAARRLGIPSAIERSGSHIRVQRRLFLEEHERLGLPPPPSDSFYDSEAGMERMVAEYELADRIIVSSTFARQTFVEAGVPAERLEVIALGANFKPEAWVPRSTSPFRVLSVAHEAVRKGMTYVLEAFRLAALPESILYLRSPALPQWRDLLQPRGSSRVVVLPRMQWRTLRPYYREAAVFCLLSIDEGFGMVVGEAMSMGCPVIVSRHVGAADMVTDGVDGFVVDVRSPAQVAEKLVYLREHPDVLQAMSQRAIEKARSYSWDRYAQSLLAMWARLP